MFLIIKTIISIELIYILFGILGFLIPLIIVLCFIRPKSRDLRNKFLSLGQLVGKSYGEIVLVCGSPDSTSITLDFYKNQVRVCEWRESNIKIVLFFNFDNICVEISPLTNIYM